MKNVKDKDAPRKRLDFPTFSALRRDGYDEGEIRCLTGISKAKYADLLLQADKQGVKPEKCQPHWVEFTQELPDSIFWRCKSAFDPGKTDLQAVKGRFYTLNELRKQGWEGTEFQAGALLLVPYLPPDGLTQEKNPGSIANVDSLAPASDDNLDDDDDSGQDVD